MITCKACGIEKDENQFFFHARKGRSKSVVPYGKCKSCHRIQTEDYRKSHLPSLNSAARDLHKTKRATNREIINARKNVPCADCGIKYPPHVMDFDHIVPRNGDRKRIIPLMANSRCTMEKLIEEMDKCEVVCANCHRERTWSRKNAFKIATERAQQFDQTR